MNQLFEDYKKAFPENCQIKTLAPHPMVSGGCGVTVTLDISEQCSQAYEAGLRAGLSERFKLPLKKCPFCGAEPKTEFSIILAAGLPERLSIVISCPECHTEKTKNLEVFSTCRWEELVDCLKEATDLWNKRVKE